MNIGPGSSVFVGIAHMILAISMHRCHHWVKFSITKTPRPLEATGANCFPARLHGSNTDDCKLTGQGFPPWHLPLIFSPLCAVRGNYISLYFYLAFPVRSLVNLSVSSALCCREFTLAASSFFSFTSTLMDVLGEVLREQLKQKLVFFGYFSFDMTTSPQQGQMKWELLHRRDNLVRDGFN